MAQFNITTTSKAGEISLNYDELRTLLIKEMEKYDYEVTEDLIKEAKEDKAKINKFAAALDNRRKEIKKEYCIPLVQFEEQMKDLYAIAKDGYTKINNQLNAFEEARKEEKAMEIAQYWQSKNFTLVPLEAIYDAKWLNKTCNDWKEQIDMKIDQINQDLNIINSFGVNDEEKEEIKGYYLDCLNIAQARSQFDAQKERREQLKKLQEQRTIQNDTQQASYAPEHAHSEVYEKEDAKEVQSIKKTRWVVEFIGTNVFKEKMNAIIKECYPDDVKVKILEKEEIWLCHLQ
ncbi:DUF1351 domain-containing protein [Clostridium sp. C1]|uniref:DUF1351 domain-containing protein n=1 Tax=Clostridium sp. C1 TaxID=1155388 RepID=UPI001BAAA819|nr:DUF1351 domain-containing protein [Clostridium sp. C1]QUN13567.1 DUF1351 domain-containing protein [Clostridium sp. C1]